MRNNVNLGNARAVIITQSRQVLPKRDAERFDGRVIWHVAVVEVNASDLAGCQDLICRAEIGCKSAVQTTNLISVEEHNGQSGSSRNGRTTRNQLGTQTRDKREDERETLPHYV